MPRKEEVADDPKKLMTTFVSALDLEELKFVEELLLVVVRSDHGFGHLVELYGARDCLECREILEVGGFIW